jgi:hypothetical protein
MRRTYATATLWATLALVAPSASFASAPSTAEQTVLQGNDPSGAADGEQPPAEHSEVIPPPPIGDEDIHTDAPNPEAGHEEEVIPTLTPSEAVGT